MSRLLDPSLLVGVYEPFAVAAVGVEGVPLAVAQRIALGGHAIPESTVRRRFDRGWENLRNGYREAVDEWAIYDASRTPPRLIETGDNRPPRTLMEDDTPYKTDKPGEPDRVAPLDDPDFIGAEAALKRASAKAIARARAAGLEPVVVDPSPNNSSEAP